MSKTPETETFESQVRDILSSHYIKLVDNPIEQAVFDILAAHTTALEAAKNSPMGVTAWIEHGKKYGYYDFAMEAAKREAREAIGQHMPHSTAKGNSLEIWSWKTPTGRKWNAAYIDSKRRPVDIAIGNSIAEALEKLAQLSHPNQPKQDGGGDGSRTRNTI